MRGKAPSGIMDLDRARDGFMPNLIDETLEASLWVEQKLSALPNGDGFGHLVSAVMWTDGYLENGKPIGGDDPSAIVDEINEQGQPLLHGHDPGRPVGRVLAAKAFKSPSGTRFVAAILAYYTHDHQLSFAALGIDPFPSADLPAVLPSLDGVRLALSVDPRDVPKPWTDALVEDAPLFVKQVQTSYNDDESLKELIRIALPYAAAVWNPLTKTLGEQAGKDVYAGIQHWLKKLWKQLTELRDPIVEIQAHHHGCTVSFLFRGHDVDQHYAAHGALSAAAAQAAKLIDTFGAHNPKLTSLTYEFEQSRWFPSYGILADGRLVSDRSILIAYEQLPKSLSMGLLLQEEDNQQQ